MAKLSDVCSVCVKEKEVCQVQIVLKWLEIFGNGTKIINGALGCSAKNLKHDILIRKWVIIKMRHG